MNGISIVNLLLLFLAIVIFLSLTINFKNSQDSGDNSLRSDIVVLSEDVTTEITNLNTSLCAKIMDVNTTLNNELSNLATILEGANMSFYLDLNQAINDVNTSLTTEIETVNTTLCTKIMDGDSFLQSQLYNLTTLIDTKISTVNNVTGDNIDMVANGTGISVQPDPMSHSIYLENTGVVTVNSVPSLTGSNDLLVTGIGMISINSFPLTSTVEVDGSALSTAVSNLQMQNNMQQMEIATLEGNVTDLQTQINNLQMMGNMIAQDLNGTTITFNMTLMTLVMDVMTLQSQVAVLQAQVANLTSAAVPPGTITPFGGTVIPSGYLLCDGSEYLMASYNDLYNVIGTMYCPGPCTNSSVFAVPDLRGKIPAGQGGTALSGAIGSSVGAETHVLSTAEMPMHSHTASSGGQSNSHSHNVELSNDNNFPAGTYPYISTFAGFTSGGRIVPTGPASADHTHSITVNSAGSSMAHNNIQPSLIVKYIIKT